MPAGGFDTAVEAPAATLGDVLVCVCVADDDEPKSSAKGSNAALDEGPAANGSKLLSPAFDTLLCAVLLFETVALEAVEAGRDVAGVEDTDPVEARRCVDALEVD